MKTARIFDVKHYSVHDGPGIRMTFFLMGCPLRCRWCQNPESQKDEQIITYTLLKCIGCGRCRMVCDRLDDHFMLPRDSCVLCGNCVKACPPHAREFGSREYTPEEVVKTAVAEKIFFDNSGGGVTFSGGECLTHSEFLAECLRLLKEKGIHTCIDTCGAVSWTAIERVLPWADLFLYDIKKINSEKHKEYTGMGNEQILSNLERLCEAGGEVIIRIPLIPGMTDQPEDMEQTARFITERLRGKIRRVELLPYNKLAGSKYGNKTIWTDYTLGEYSLGDLEPQTNEYVASLGEIFKNHGIAVFAEKL